MNLHKWLETQDQGMNLDVIQVRTFSRFLDSSPFALPYDLYIWAVEGGVPYLGALTFPC